MSAFCYAMGLSPLQDRHDLAAVIIRTGDALCDVIEHTQISSTIFTVTKFILSYPKLISSIGFCAGTEASPLDLMRLSQETKIPLFTQFKFKGLPAHYQRWALLGYAIYRYHHKHHNSPFHMIHCDDRVYTIKIANPMRTPDISKIEISSFRRLLANITNRIYDTPVDIEGKIIPLGTYSDRLHKQLRDIIPNLNSQWKKADDNNLALTILRHALRWRMQEPDLIHTLYDYLVGSISENCSSLAATWYTAGRLIDYPWFMAMLEKYVKKIIRFQAVPTTHLNAFQAAILTGLKHFSPAHGTYTQPKNLRAAAYLLQ
jgi:hypothetical protein